MADIKELRNLFCMVMKDVMKGKSKDVIAPDAVKPLLVEFSDLMLNELLDELPPMRDIQQ